MLNKPANSVANISQEKCTSAAYLGKDSGLSLECYLLNSRKSPRKSHFLCDKRSCVTEWLEFSDGVSNATDGMSRLLLRDLATFP